MSLYTPTHCFEALVLRSVAFSLGEPTESAPRVVREGDSSTPFFMHINTKLDFLRSSLKFIEIDELREYCQVCQQFGLAGGAYVPAHSE